jgi:histidinol-phosphatase (PHP family)
MANYSCLHTHTSFCDGQGSVEDFCAAAHAKGLVSIGFSAHAPLPAGLRSGWHLRAERFGEYREAVRAARSAWRGKLAVYLGLEADYIEGRSSAANFDRDALGLDYIIGSVHYVTASRCVDCPPADFARLVKEDFGGDAMALADRYWDLLEKSVAAGGFDIAGHADLIKKNNADGRWFSPADERYDRRIRRAADAIAASGIAVEVNTGGLNRGFTSEPYPSVRFLRLLRAKDVPVLISADAHRPEHLGGGYAEARRVLLEAGYTTHRLFEGRADGQPRWREERL